MERCRKQKRITWPSETLKTLQELTHRSFVNFLIKGLSKVIKYHPDKECLVLDLLKSFVISLEKTLKQPKKLATYTPELARKNNWMTLIDKLNTSETLVLSTLTTLLLKISVPELISREKDYKKFWTCAYRDVSKKLWSPTEIDYPDLGLTSSELLLKKQEGSLPLLTIQETIPQNKNLQKTCYQSFISTHVDKWVNESTQRDQSMPEKLAWKMKLNLTSEQKKVIDTQLKVSNYVYNKAITAINNKSIKLSKFGLRDYLVTENTRKHNVLYCYINRVKTLIDKIRRELRANCKNSLKDAVKLYMFTHKWYNPFITSFKTIELSIVTQSNELVKDFERSVEKEIKQNAVYEAYQNYTTCKSMISSGLIKYFKLKYRSKRKHGLSMTYAGAMFRVSGNKLYFTSRKMTDKQVKMHPRTLKKFTKLKLTNLPYCKIVKQLGVYYLCIPIDAIKQEQTDQKRIIALDPGVRTFLTGYDPNSKLVEFHYNSKTDRLDKLMQKLKQFRLKRVRGRIRRRTLVKIELKKQWAIDELHYSSISYLVKNYDLIFLERFDSQKCVKGNKNKTNNRRINNLKPYTFRTRLLYKAGLAGKIVKVVSAPHTSKTCSNCGNWADMGGSKTYNCSSCKSVLDRDANAAKNILMKGLLN